MCINIILSRLTIEPGHSTISLHVPVFWPIPVFQHLVYGYVVTYNLPGHLVRSVTTVLLSGEPIY